MVLGIIYLIQPKELTGTKRYKIGCSQKPTLDRCQKGYKNGSRYLMIMECNNPLYVEKCIKDNFNDKFNLIAGNEYFEVNIDEQKLIQYFYEIVMNNKNKIINDKSEESNIKEAKIENEKNIILVNTYDDYIKYSNIKNIIITNKRRKDGFIRYSNKLYQLLNCKDDLLFDNVTMLSLDDVVNNLTNCLTSVKLDDNEYIIKYDTKSIIRSNHY